MQWDSIEVHRRMPLATKQKKLGKQELLRRRHCRRTRKRRKMGEDAGLAKHQRPLLHVLDTPGPKLYWTVSVIVVQIMSFSATQVIHLGVLTGTALMMKYERWLIDAIGLQGWHLRLFQVIALVLGTISFGEIVRFLLRRPKEMANRRSLRPTSVQRS